MKSLCNVHSKNEILLRRMHTDEGGILRNSSYTVDE